MTAVVETDGARQALRPPLGAVGLHPDDPGRAESSASSGQRRRQETLLHLAVGLLTRRGLDLRPAAAVPARPAQLARVGFVAQDTPIYAGLSVADHLRMGARPTRSGTPARRTTDRAARPRPAQRAGRLSGGQRAQLALTLAVAKRPELLILDEPVASLDPLARREFLQGLMEAVAEHGST